jgi:hypothetical protein
MYFICENCHHVFLGGKPECPECGGPHLISQDDLITMIDNRILLLRTINEKRSLDLDNRLNELTKNHELTKNQII